MKEALILDAIAGKTISGVVHGDAYHENYVVIAFTDGSYTCLCSHSGYDGDTSIDVESLEWDDIIGDNAGKYVALGVVAAEEVFAEEQRRREADDRRKAWAEQNERAKYEELKRKYEGMGSLRSSTATHRPRWFARRAGRSWRM